jgi:hypothetical protein
VPAALLAVELLVCEFRVRFVLKDAQVVRNELSSRSGVTVDLGSTNLRGALQ